MKIIKGGLCSVDGVKASGVRKGKYGMAIISNPGSKAAAIFTSNKVLAAPVIVTREHIQDGEISAVVANSGNANCFTGEPGLRDSREMAEKLAEKLNITPQEVGVSSTGVIGREMPMEIIGELIEEGFDALEHSAKASANAAKAIMTTDTYYKELSVETTLKDGKKVRIGGICKGSGMIAPNMGTMLCFITTDIQATPQELESSLKKAVDESFNMVVVDGDESTNDTVLIMANGKSGKIDENFQKALNFLCIELAKDLARDGEGATKLIEVTIKGAYNKEEARKAAISVVKSPLVKAAVFGSDPNWGRIVAAVGYSGARVDPEKISVILSSDSEEVNIVDQGKVKAFENTEELHLAEKIMQKEEIKIVIDLGEGNDSATAFGCDLSCDYVKINAEYTT